jgi:16S rRNA processing protein RimM
VSRLEVGRVTKAHGLRGDVVVKLTTDRRERVEPGARLWVDDVEMVVAHSRPDKHRFVVRFDSVADRDGADRLVGATLTAEPLEAPDDDAFWVHDLIGAAVVDADGTGRGTVTEVLANPAADILLLDTGSLVPMTFVTGFVGGVVTVEVPAGLWDL